MMWNGLTFVSYISVLGQVTVLRLLRANLMVYSTMLRVGLLFLFFPHRASISCVVCIIRILIFRLCQIPASDSCSFCFVLWTGDLRGMVLRIDFASSSISPVIGPVFPVFAVRVRASFL